ncbi:MAG TPA: DUF1501 domain-containing protein [Pirellulaceae bacterium]|nr:DUF1501 domain-containing protein [Pirellulaceae bacterium]
MPNRREFLHLGLSGLASLTLPQLYHLRSAAAASGDAKRKAIIVVFLHGGASHLETWDPKPDAPLEYRGPFQSIATKTPGLRLSELLPRQAAISNRFNIVRSLVHTGFCHGIGQQQMFTGHEVREFKPQSEHPEFLSITNRLRGGGPRQVPNYVGAPPIPYLGAAYLGPAAEAFAVHGDPNLPEFRLPNVDPPDQANLDRIDQRRGLRERLDRLARSLDDRGNMQAGDQFEQMAWNMLASPAARRAFDLSQEDPAVRDRYGRNTWGQQCLLTRRLVEAGVELVTTTLAGPLCGRVQNWDDHAVNHHVFDAMQSRAPYFDQAVAALIEDLIERGLDRQVLVVVTGEFGRTPKISYAADSASGVMQPGRDHWPRATSLLFAGGGLETGQVIGGTDRRGEDVVERRISVHDFLATVYRHLEIDPRGIAFNDFAGRPVPILNLGKPIPELLAAC